MVAVTLWRYLGPRGVATVACVVVDRFPPVGFTARVCVWGVLGVGVCSYLGSFTVDACGFV